MNTQLSERELYALFQQHLPVKPVPLSFMERIHAQVLAEVAIHIIPQTVDVPLAVGPKQDQASLVAYLPSNHSESIPPTSWLEQVRSWISHFEFGTAPVLAGTCAVALLLLLGILRSSLPVTPSLAMVHVDSGRTYIIRESSQISEVVTAGEAIQLEAGDELVTESGMARIEYDSGHRTELMPATKVQINQLSHESGDTKIALRLLQGEIENHVDTQLDENDLFQVSTGSITVSVPSTSSTETFTVKTRPESEVYVATQDGPVDVETLDGQHIVVLASVQLVTVPGRPVIIVAPTRTPTIEEKSPVELIPNTQSNSVTPVSNSGALQPTPTPQFVVVASETVTPEPVATLHLLSETPVLVEQEQGTGLPATGETDLPEPSIVQPTAIVPTDTATPVPTTPLLPTATLIPTFTYAPTLQPTSTETNTPVSPSPTPVPPTAIPPTATPIDTVVVVPTPTWTVVVATATPTTIATSVASPTATTITPGGTIPQLPGGTIPQAP